jgi:cation diffusion facilitator CzcD-associated flavoprotein CzcO
MSASSSFECVLFEQSDSLYGVWNYAPSSPSLQHSIPLNLHEKKHPMYKLLRTNLPHIIMAYGPDLPFEDGGIPSFPHHSHVKKYLKEIVRRGTAAFHGAINLNTKVTRVSKGKGEGQWDVSFQSTTMGTVGSVKADAVVVCSGHFSHPILPADDDYKGTLHLFTPKVSMHSISYDDPAAFQGMKNVLIVGAKASGRDIGKIVASCLSSSILSLQAHFSKSTMHA